MTRRDVNEGDVFRKGFATSALEKGATEGQVPAIGTDGEVAFVAAGGGSQTTHGIMGNALNSFNGVDQINYPEGTGTPEWQIIYDTDGYVSGDPTDFYQMFIPAGLGGMYALEAIIYLEDAEGLTGASFVFDEPSNSCDFEIQPSLGAYQWLGHGSWVRPLLEGSRVRFNLAHIAGVGSVHVLGGSQTPVHVDPSVSNFTLTRLGPLPEDFTGYPG